MKIAFTFRWKWLKRLGYFLAVLLLGVFLLVYLMVFPVLSHLTHNHDEKTNTPAKWGLPYEDVRIPSARGFAMPSWIIAGKKNAPVIIICNGSSGYKSTSPMQAMSQLLHKVGYTLVLYDSRGQGETPGIKTFGIGECFDLQGVLDFCEARFGQDRFGFLGVSMSSATVLRLIGNDTRLHAVVACAPYAEFSRELIRNEVRANARFLPSGFGRIAANLLYPWMLKPGLYFWSFRFTPLPSPLQGVMGMSGKQALLLVHGLADPEISPLNSRRLYAACSGNKELLLLKGIGHEIPYRSKTFRKKVVQFYKRHLGH